MPRAALPFVIAGVAALAATGYLLVAPLNRSGNNAVRAWQGLALEDMPPITQFEARGERGQQIASRRLGGRPFVLVFIDHTCGASCPAQVQSIRGALDRLDQKLPVIAAPVERRLDCRQARDISEDQRMLGRMDVICGSSAEIEPAKLALGELELSPETAAVLFDAGGRPRVVYSAATITARAVAQDLKRLLA